MSYSIKIHFETGDSFNNYTTQDTLELSWNNLDVAKQNLQRIKEHYEQYKTLNSSYSRLTEKEIKDLLQQNSIKDWFVADKSRYHGSVKLYADDNAVWQISCFWCGYFERLLRAEIVAIEPENNDMAIDF